LFVLAVLLPRASTWALDLASPLGRWSIEGYVHGLAVVPTDPGTPDQRPSALLDLKVDDVVHRMVRIHLDTHLTLGGPQQDAAGFGFINWQDTFQNVSPNVELDEAYLDLFLAHADFRLGKQPFAWGRLDAFQPTDVLNPRRYLDPFLSQNEEAKIGIPAASVAYYPPPVAGGFATQPSVKLIWIPVPLPSRFPLEEERWFPSDALVPDLIRIPRGFLPSPVEGVTVPEVNVRTTIRTENLRPPQQLDEGGFGVRAGAQTGPVDWALAYYDGPETAPAFDFTTVAFSPRARRRAQRPGFMTDLDDLKNIRSIETIRPIFGRIRLVGIDGAFSLGELSGRVEAAYAQNRLLPRSVFDLFSLDSLAGTIRPPLSRIGLRLLEGKRTRVDIGPLTVARDTVEWGAGFDYTLKSWTLLVQANQTFVLNNSTELLIDDVDTRLLLHVRRPFLGDRLTIDFTVLQGIARGYTSCMPKIAYSLTDRLKVGVGFLLIAGSRRTLVGQFHDNDEAFFEARYSF
jgi:hypothetical protein